MSGRGGVVVVVAGGHVGVGVAPLVLHPGPRVALRPVLGPETSAVIAQHYILQVDRNTRSLYSPPVWIIVGGVAVAHGAVWVVGAVVSGPRGNHRVGVCAVHGVAPPRQRGAVVIVVAGGFSGGHGEAASLGSGLRVARDYMGHHLSPVSGREVECD